ncbi:N-acetylmuramoyl-L-alanine amidase [bacterium]|nr:N-acetylmuramoyl-L-alanine amidase [bacterium]
MRAALAVLLAWTLVFSLAPAWAGTHYLMLGNKVVSFDHAPVVESGGTTYLTLALLDELGLAAPNADETAQLPVQLPFDPAARIVAFQADSGAALPNEHYNPDDTGDEAPTEEDVGGSATELSPLPPPKTTAELLAGRRRYRLAGHTLDVAYGQTQPAVELDGGAVSSLDLLRHDGHDYLSDARYADVGLKLAFNAQEDLFQAVGLIHRVTCGNGADDLSLGCLTPVSVEGIQVDDQRITVIVEGGFLADTAGRDFPGDPYLTKVGFKSQPVLGRSFIFIHQPRRTGFNIQTDPDLGYARVRFGNYFQLASYQQSSSGDLSITIQLGAPCEPETQFLNNPPRLVADFPGVTFEDATKTIPVHSGSVEQIRVGRPQVGTVRVVLDLTEYVDYRLLSTDDGARHYIQLLPPTPVAATSASQFRRGRTIMIDPGHGGSDPGAEGVIDGVWEADINLEICRYLETELTQLGYQVLTTRDRDTFVSLGARADYANRVLPYVFVSVHNNSLDDPAYQGLMTFHHPASRRGPRLAQLIQEEVLRSTGAVDKNVRQANFFVLRETVVPSALVECGVLTNLEECRRLIDPTYQQRIAQGIARGIDRYVTGL